jgi:hypothetical protein
MYIAFASTEVEFYDGRNRLSRPCRLALTLMERAVRAESDRALANPLRQFRRAGMIWILLIDQTVSMADWFLPRPN